MPDEAKKTAPETQKRQRLTVEQRIAQLDAQRQRLLAQAQKTSRQLDTRRKIIVGAAVLNAMETDPVLKTRICELLQSAVVRPIDREAVAPWLSRTSTSQS